MALSGDQWLMLGVGAFGAALAVWTAVVYHGWAFARHASVDRARRRLWWFFLRHDDLLTSRATPFGVLLGSGFALIGLGGIPVVEQSGHPAVWMVAAGFLVVMVGVVLTVIHPRRFFAGWHREEIERAHAGQPSLIEPPPEGRSMTMTSRERVFAWVLIVGMFVAWWVLSLPPTILIGIGTLLGLMAIIEVRQR